MRLLRAVPVPVAYLSRPRFEVTRRPGLSGFFSGTLFDTTPASSGHGACSMAYWNFNPAAALDPLCQGVLYSPAIAAAAAPGLPVGYDPTTGQVIGNVSGATVVPDLQAAVAAANLPGAPGSDVPWYCAYLGIGCNPSGPGFSWGSLALAAGIVGAGALLLARRGSR